MATSFYQTDLCIREVTDSGLQPTGGISSAKVRDTLAQIQRRHQRINIPSWMQTYFGFSLLENVEKQCAQRHPQDGRDDRRPLDPRLDSTDAAAEHARGLRAALPHGAPEPGASAVVADARQAPDAQGRGGTAEGRPGRALKPKAYNPKPKT